MLLSILLDQISSDVVQVIRCANAGTMDKAQIEGIAAFYAGGLTNTLFQYLKQDLPINEEQFLGIIQRFLII